MSWMSSIDNMETKKLCFKYNKKSQYFLLGIGIFIICFATPLPILVASLRWVWTTSGFFQGQGEFEPVLILTGIFILLICIGLFAVSIFYANLLSARISEREGLAEFMETELRLIWNKRTIKIKYEDISKIVCQLTVLSNISLPPIGDLYIGLLNSKKIVVQLSTAEAWEKKKEYIRFRKSEPGYMPGGTSLWNVSLELRNRTGKNIDIWDEKVVGVKKLWHVKHRQNKVSYTYFCFSCARACLKIH